jgi:hypothetical protein
MCSQSGRASARSPRRAVLAPTLSASDVRWRDSDLPWRPGQHDGDVGFSPAEKRQDSTDPGVASMKLNYLGEPPERLGAEALEQTPD